MACPKTTLSRIGLGLAITILAITISLLIVYNVRLGTGNEVHTTRTMGTCRINSNGASSSSLKIMTFNTFLINCSPGVRCQNAEERAARVTEITNWFLAREEGIVLFQEVWSYHDELRSGMSEAGYRHSVMTNEEGGSGLAVFSRFPLDDGSTKFVDWFDAFGSGDSLTPELTNLEAFMADKGVLYVKIVKGGDSTPVHVFNFHTNSDTNGDYHEVRVGQFQVVRDFVDSQQIPSNELVIMGGDFNEDIDCRLRRCEGGAKCQNQEYYNEMIETLSAGTLDVVSETNFTYDTEKNNVLKGLYAETDCDYYQYRLDYTFFDKKHMIPEDTSSCSVLNPLASDGSDLSDHLPLSCTIAGIVAMN
ncbi:hypothetical protein ACHAXN_005612 [Cyclotella atomus]